VICLNRGADEEAAERDDWQAKAACEVLIDEGLGLCQYALGSGIQEALTSA
jgi:hypothetical protein